MGHWKPDIFDYQDTEDCEDLRPQCKRCGSTAVRWRQQGGKWVLFSLTPGVVHICELSGDAFCDES